ALSADLTSLLFSRVLQGAGAALLMPNSLAILGGAFSGEARGRAIGTWAAVGAMMGAVGPVLGGWLIDRFGWHSIFLINVPLAVGAIWLAQLYVDREQQAERTLPLDIFGAVFATLALAGLSWGLTIGAGPHGWTSAAMAAVGAGAILLIGFIW